MIDHPVRAIDRDGRVCYWVPGYNDPEGNTPAEELLKRPADFMVRWDIEKLNAWAKSLPTYWDRQRDATPTAPKEENNVL